MEIRKPGFAWLLVPGTLIVWLLWLAPERVAGLDSGLAGSVLMVLTAATAAWLLSRSPQPPGSGLGPGEQQAWLGLIVAAVIYAYLLSRTGTLGTAESLVRDPDAYRIGSHIGLMAIAWLVLASWLNHRRAGEVLKDERDRLIAAHADSAGNGALIVGLIGLILMLAITPSAQLAWATPTRLAVALLHLLILRGLIGYNVRVALYWWDRR